MSYKEKRPKIRTIIKNIEVDDKELFDLPDKQLKTVLGGLMHDCSNMCTDGGGHPDC